MPARLPLRVPPALLGAALCAAVLAGCGKVEQVVPTKVDAAPAERALRQYLDNDRCDLLSDAWALRIGETPAAGRELCENGRLPVDAAVRPGEYEVTDAEVIDEQGLVSIELRDGGTRDYVLVPGGDEGFLVDSVQSNTEVDVGKPLRLQARLGADTPLIDARITVRRLERIPEKDLSVDEFVTSLDRYYRVRIRIQNLRDEPADVGTLGFTLAQENGFKVGEPKPAFSQIGTPLPSTVPPNGAVKGDLFFAIPSVEIARPAQVWFQMGEGDSGAKLVWL
ncbi:MAG: hypothetical protein JHD16_08215, partial [Solirubrobacteraceae bacterium]|nr:hypothetical protein [Solirubrobacteraceae bacterium]